MRALTWGDAVRVVDRARVSAARNALVMRDAGRLAQADGWAARAQAFAFIGRELDRCVRGAAR